MQCQNVLRTLHDIATVAAGVVDPEQLAGQVAEHLPTSPGETFTAMAIPLIVGKRAVGVLSARHDPPRKYTSDDLQVLTLVAARIANLEVQADRPWADQVAEPWSEPVSPRPHVPIESLTERDRQILRLLARGLTNREIGSVLHLSPGTVRNRVGQLLTKLGATDRTQAAVLALTKGVLEIE